MDASQILKHPFITDDPTLQNTQPSFKIPGTFGISQSDKPERISGVCGPSLDPPYQADTRDQNDNNRSRPLSTLAMHLNHLDHRQGILKDISNIVMKKPTVRDRSLPVKRVFSDPISFKTPYCISEVKKTNSDSPLNSDAPKDKEKSVLTSEALSGTYNVALPSQSNIPLDGRQVSTKPLKLSNKILPSVSHAYCCVRKIC
jgi:hypothetical protein